LGEYTESSILAFNVGLFLTWDGKVKKLVNVIALANNAVVLLGIESILKNAAGVEVVFLAAIGAELVN
jgi:hypothetical protein